LRGLCRTLVRLKVAFSKLDSPISLAFLERYPSPAYARGLGEQRLAAFLARQRSSGHKTPGELSAKLRRAPEGRVGEALVAAIAAELLAEIGRLPRATHRPAPPALADRDHRRARELTLSRRIVHDRDTFRELLGDPHGTDVALEATYGWEWLAELLEEAGYGVHLAHPLRTQAIAPARGRGDVRLGQKPGTQQTAMLIIAEVGDVARRLGHITRQGSPPHCAGR
jgi:hypothetical protein